jgi:hypothetical protein
VMERNITGKKQGGPGRSQSWFRSFFSVIRKCEKLCLWDCISGRPGENVMVLA